MILRQGRSDIALTHSDIVLTHSDIALTRSDIALTRSDIVLTNSDIRIKDASLGKFSLRRIFSFSGAGGHLFCRKATYHFAKQKITAKQFHCPKDKITSHPYSPIAYLPCQNPHWQKCALSRIMRIAVRDISRKSPAASGNFEGMENLCKIFINA